MPSPFAVAPSPPLRCFHSLSSLHPMSRWNIARFSNGKLSLFSPIDVKEGQKRQTLICAANQEAEELFKKIVEVDRLIDTIRDANGNEKDYEEFASTLMSIVDRVVNKTNEKIEYSTNVLKGIIKPALDEVEEIPWPPRDPETLKLMEREINQRELEGELDEGFLSEVNAQLRKAKEDGDKPGLEAMLQKVFQLYAAKVLSRRSYARKGNQILKAEVFLETIIKAPEEEWNKLLINGITLGKGEISPEELHAVIKKRIERTLIRTDGGSYEQRVLVEYLKGIQKRAEEVVQVLQGKKPQ
ncbi:uncharacterized protein LOC131325163 isoform X2 [Rhododendron vialii]|uniref:uncharacterized protein LOC131325163 isoform X2 n=1 Tax=Rhododendron vialii TaxID=182163 RepID=UPI00265D91CF|nr:uncharacterized protein LOC131325163 isoform X2 [Rhododendron vialii]